MLEHFSLLLCCFESYFVQLFLSEKLRRDRCLSLYLSENALAPNRKNGRKTVLEGFRSGVKASWRRGRSGLVPGAPTWRMGHESRRSGTISAMMKNPKHTLISASTGFALLAVAMGAAAVGAIAVGAVAVGAFTIGKFGMRRGRIEKLEIGELTLDRLVILERTSEEVKE
jgi:hypothetical protein